MGEPKKTAELHVLAGNPSKLSREQLKVRAAEDKQQPGVSAEVRPRLPKHLSKEAVIVWRATVRLMRARGTISAGDVPALEVYAEVSARWQAAKADVAVRGIVVSVVKHDKQGNEYTTEMTNPCLAVVQDCERQLLALAKALGLTPDTRERVKPTARSKAAQAKPGSVAAMFPNLFKDK
jgi:P27 family predicted phage terminase small subunit